MPGRRVPLEVPRSLTGEPSDHSLLSRFRGGDQEAATQLYSRYAGRLNGLVEMQCSTELARREGVEDIVQSVFRSFFRRAGQGFYDVPDEDELWKLFLVIALNKIRSKATYHHAFKRSAHRTIDGVEGRLLSDSQASARGVPDHQFELVLKEILEQLPARSRLMVKLRVDGCDVAEVAGITGRSRRSVERILQASRRQLRELLEQED
jgi:RNA polymerase sigma-70 factor, ECF subfamily